MCSMSEWERLVMLIFCLEREVLKNEECCVFV